MFDCTKDLGGGYEDRYVVVKNVTFPSAPELDDTMAMIDHTSLFGSEHEYCWMHAGNAINDQRAEIATFDSVQAANEALGKLVARWGTQAVSGDEDSRVEIKVVELRFIPVAVEYTIDTTDAFKRMHNVFDN